MTIYVLIVGLLILTVNLVQILHVIYVNLVFT
jgi:hypothetical protein